MFLSIYANGNFLKSQNLDQALSYPGEYWVLDITNTNNLSLIGRNKISQKPKIGSYLLESCERIHNGYRFSFCDDRDNMLYRKDVLRGYIENSLSFIIKCFFEASKFPNWEIYSEYLNISELTKEIANLKEKALQLELTNKTNSQMITNSLYTRPEFIGINIEKVRNEFIISVAFREEGKWKAKTLGGISGNIGDLKLFEKVVSDGQNLDEENANSIFQKAQELGLEFSQK